MLVYQTVCSRNSSIWKRRVRWVKHTVDRQTNVVEGREGGERERDGIALHVLCPLTVYS